MPRLFPLPPTTPRPNPPRPSAAPPLPGNVTTKSPTSAGHPKADLTTPATHASGSESAADEASGALHYEADPEAQQKRNPEKQENVLPAVGRGYLPCYMPCLFPTSEDVLLPCRRCIRLRISPISVDFALTAACMHSSSFLFFPIAAPPHYTTLFQSMLSLASPFCSPGPVHVNGRPGSSRSILILVRVNE